MIFLNLEMNTNLSDLQNLKSSQRFTLPADKTSQQTENIQTDGSKSEHALPDGVRPDPVSPDFRPSFGAFEHEEEGAEEPKRWRLGAAQTEEQRGGVLRSKDEASRRLRMRGGVCRTDEEGSCLGSHQLPTRRRRGQ